MEQHRDEHIDCADCGASFVFSADEAAVFAGRGLAAPKRCKDCRRARKERAANGGPGGQRRPSGAFGARDGNHGNHGNQAPRPAGNGPPRGAAPRYGVPVRRYTGDVNEYRSPMQDGFAGAPQGRALRSAPRQGSDEYRSPMPDGFRPTGVAPRPFRADRPSGPRPPAPLPDTPSARPAANKRRRPQAEMFAVTCDACGAQAEVPFKPAEGREVYCPTCYRARRPA